MTTLILGANTALSQHTITVQATPLSHQVGMVWLPLDEQRRAKISPAYLHEPKDWAKWQDDKWLLDLDKAFKTHGVQRLQLVIYAYYDPNLAVPAHEMVDISLTIDNTINYQVCVGERHIKTSLVLEIYERQGQYKCRALGEHSTQSLKAFGDYLQIALQERMPSSSSESISDYQPSRPQAGETWTGTAFAIDEYHLLTCHHVIDGATMIGLRQQGRADQEAFVVMSDEGSDTAILRVNQPLPSKLSITTGQPELLGETIITLGFPLSGLAGGLQVTTGNVAALSGIRGDIRFLQFTAPIQPGSSGSPVLLANGAVIGMVTSSLSNAQNMNYAAKYQLLSALLTSAGVTNTPSLHANLATPELIRRHKESIWLVGCGA